MIIAVHFTLFALLLLCVAAYFRLSSPQESAGNPIFVSFQRRYIPVYLLVLLGDWLQGPYMYKLYHFYEFEEDQVAVIYVCGILSSALFFPAKDIIGDRLGRRLTCALCCLLYAASCLMTLSPSYGVLILGRCLCGLANTLLFSSAETWYITEHRDVHEFPKEWTQVTFRRVAVGSSVVAIGAGVLSDIVSRWMKFGPVSPSVLASPVFLLAAVLIPILWSENYGPVTEVTWKNAQHSCSRGLAAIAPNVDLFLVGSIQSLFETTLLIFVYIWTPALDTSNNDVPLGVAFASFMVCYLLGNILCENLVERVGYSITRMLLVVCGAASVVFSFAAYSAKNYRFLMFTLLLLFELLCGFYFPIMRILRERVFPEEHRVSVINWFRIPLTVISSLALVLLHDSHGGVPEILTLCAVLMGLAFLCSIRFARAARDNALTTSSVSQ